jgi:hypothetical protein
VGADIHNLAASCGSGSTWQGAADCSGAGPPQHIQLTEGVDYFNTAMPGYTAYTYPHPLRGEGTTTVAPTLSGITLSGGLH